MENDREENANNRLYRYIREEFDRYVRDRHLSMTDNNELIAIRNRLYNLFRAILAEQQTKDRHGIDVDYIFSDIPRYNLSEDYPSIWLKGEIEHRRPAGPTNEEIGALVKRVRQLCDQTTLDSSISLSLLCEDIIREIKHTFVLPNANIPFVTNRLYDRTPNSPPDFHQNTPCEICRENRTIDICHIIPAAYGGSKNPTNILYLCPTHHRLFDRCMLTEEEWNQIEFLNKSKAAANYAQLVIKPAMERFWQRIRKADYRKTTSMAIAAEDQGRGNLSDDLDAEIVEILRESPGATIGQIAAKASIDEQHVRTIIIVQKRYGLVRERRINGQRQFYLVANGKAGT